MHPSDSLGFRILRFFPDRIAAVIVMLFARSVEPLLNTHGYAHSIRRQIPVDANGEPLPWLPYCVVALLGERLRNDLAVLEFGAGYSTLYFMRRVSSVTSIEHDASWARLLRERVLGNVQIVHADAGSAAEYVAHLQAGQNSYDLVIVDGIFRNDCFRSALRRLTARGVIILDDSDRPEYEECFSLARDAGFRALRLHGHKAQTVGLHWTTLFYRDENCLQL